jgi:hypothetical protein
MARKHGSQWTDMSFPWMGNWRNLADYSIAAALAYPESVTYRQDNNTFAVERAMLWQAIYRPTPKGWHAFRRSWPYLQLSQYIQATPDVNPTEAPNGLAGRWFDRQSGRP